MKRFTKAFLFAGLIVGFVGVRAQAQGPQITLSFGTVTTDDSGMVTDVSEAPCGETIDGGAGDLWDDGTGGADLFFDPEAFAATFEEIPNDRPGQTIDVIVETEGNPSIGDPGCDTADPLNADGTCAGVQGWSYGVGTEGALTITDITTNGTVSCVGGRFPRTPECLQIGGFELAELTGSELTLPDGETIDRPGPDVPENAGAVSAIVLAQMRKIELPLEGAATVVKLRVLGEFPEEEDMSNTGRLFFEPRTGSGQEVPNIATWNGQTFNDKSDPPLALEDCEVTLRALGVPPVNQFIRCDPNDDGKNNIADSIWIVNDLFRGGPQNACLGANDCNDDGMKDLSDAMFAIMYQFMGGPAPSAPFPSCGTDADSTPENCPGGSTSCPEV